MMLSSRTFQRKSCQNVLESQFRETFGGQLLLDKLFLLHDAHTTIFLIFMVVTLTLYFCPPQHHSRVYNSKCENVRCHQKSLSFSVINQLLLMMML